MLDPISPMIVRFLASELVSELYCDEVLAGDGSLLQIDSPFSVSALAEAEAADRFSVTQRERLALLSSVVWRP